MDKGFVDGIKALSAEFARKYAEHLVDYEALTVAVYVQPFFRMMGYDTSNPKDVRPEFTADGSGGSSKVDFALMHDGKPSILVECKSVGDSLEGSSGQLFYYFTSTDVKFGVMTEGLKWLFYSDIDKTNKMDERPFFVLDMLDVSDEDIETLWMFTKDGFDVDTTKEMARRTKTVCKIDRVWDEILGAVPPDELVAIARGKVYSGRQTQAAVQEWDPQLLERWPMALARLASRMDTPSAADGLASPDSRFSQNELAMFKKVQSLLEDVVVPERLSMHRKHGSKVVVRVDDTQAYRVCEFMETNGTFWLQVGLTKNPYPDVGPTVNGFDAYTDDLKEVARQFV